MSSRLARAAANVSLTVAGRNGPSLTRACNCVQKPIFVSVLGCNSASTSRIAVRPSWFQNAIAGTALRIVDVPSCSA